MRFLKPIITILFFAFCIILLDGIVYWGLTHEKLDNKFIHINPKFEYRFGDSPFNEQGIPLWITDKANSPEWKLQETDKLPAKERNNNNFVWMRLTLPLFDGNEQPYLYIFRAYDKFEMYSDHQKIYASDDLNDHPEKISGSPSHLIPIDRSLLGKTVYFRVYSDSPYIGINAKIRLGSGPYILLDLIRADLDKLFIGLLFIFIGVTAIFFFLSNRKERAILHFSLFSISAGTLVLVQLTKLNTFLWNTPILDYYLNIFSVFMISYPFLSFVEQVYGKGYKSIILRLKQFSLFYFIFVIFLCILNPKYIVDYYIYNVYSFFILVILITLVALLLSSLLKRTEEKDKIVLTYGFCIFAVVSIKDRILQLIIPFYYIPLDLQNGIVGNFLKPSMEWSLLCLIITFALVLIRRFTQVHEKNMVYSQKLEEQNKELKQIDKIKDEFIANTSHELRTPIHGMIGITESILEGTCGPVSDQMKHNLIIVANSGKRLSHLINDILDYSKIRNDQIELNVKTVQLTDIVNSVIALCKPLSDHKPIQLINRMDEKTPLVFADANRIQQIMYNLIGNAIKFTEKGSIEIYAHVVNTQLEITVSDTGIGIPQDKLDHIFESFQQADSSITREYGGSGLGLSITKQLVELHGGHVIVDSIEGKGSSFTFSLPLSFDEMNTGIEQSTHDIALMPKDAYASPTFVLQDKRIEPSNHLLNDSIYILIVDDEPANIQVLLNFLSSENYHVLQSSNGFEALEIIERGFEPDLVILDVMMPRMSGYEVCKKIREWFPIDELPVILLTAKNLEENVVEGFEVGANDYLTKPFSKKELLARVKMHIRLSKWHRMLEKAVSERTETVRNLLDHAGQGFLSFGQDLRINEDYSKECTQIFDRNIANEYFDELLYSNNEEQKLFVKNVATKLFQETSPGNLDILISYLPNEISIGRRFIQLEYKMIRHQSTKSCMVILTDYTDKQSLEVERDKERTILKMIISVVVNQEAFFECIQQFDNFRKMDFNRISVDSLSLELQQLRRDIHTMKGCFSQFYMVNTKDYLQKCELSLTTSFKDTAQSDRHNLEQHINPQNLSACFEMDIAIITEILGDEFLKNKGKILVDSAQLLYIENKIQSLFLPNETKWLIVELRKFRYKPIRDMFIPYMEYTKQLSELNEKPVYPLTVEGGEELLVDLHQYTPFSKALGHLFRNTFDHGFETKDERIQLGKDTKGTILCLIKKITPAQMLSIEIIDDGKGIDPEFIKTIALERKLHKIDELAKLTDEEVLQSIFIIGFSTKPEINEHAGLGIGLNAVKETIEELGGTIQVKSIIGQGTTFQILLPYDPIDYVYNAN